MMGYARTCRNGVLLFSETATVQFLSLTESSSVGVRGFARCVCLKIRL